MDRDRLVDDLTLALIHLTSWKERSGGQDVQRAWKSYDWDALDRLADAGLITFTNKAKSLYLTEKGAKAAEAVAMTYGRLADLFSAAVEDASAGLEHPVANAPAFEFRVDLDLWSDERECWRQIVVPQSWSFIGLHEAIQSSFLWWGYHMWDFKLVSHRKKLEVVDPEQHGVDAMFAWRRESYEQVDAGKLGLSEVFPRTRTATYSYDYGDGWEHKVRLVRAIDSYQGQMPVCTAGAGDAPPEDVGAPMGFEEFLRAIEDAGDPEHDDMVAWGESLFFERFSLEAVNERMRKWFSGELFDEWDERNGS